MKKIILIIMLMTVCITYAQKKKNGTIYLEHPAIVAVEAMTKAFVSGDADKVANYLADDFRSINGTNINKEDKGQDKAAYLKSVKGWKDNIDYLSMTRSQGAYPDALEYEDANQSDVVWVQTWEDIKGVHKKTGVKIDMPMHRLYTVDKNNKIKTMISYSTSKIADEIAASNADRKNGVIYNHHEYINTVRKMIYAFEKKDFDKAYSFYDEKASFSDINQPLGTSFTLKEQKANDKKFFDEYEVESFDQVGYPDYLHYELGNASNVLSWWNFRLIRKSDRKSIVVPVFYTHEFDDKGKITNEMAYYSEKAFDGK